MEQSKNIVVTGANGFIGKNLIADLNQQNSYVIKPIVRNTPYEKMEEYLSTADIVFHLAGVNRPKKNSEFYEGNRDFTLEITEILKKQNNQPVVILTSSIQAENESDYGQSKKAGEQIIVDFAASTGSKALIYRLPNVFGKWCKPNYNSVVATFCHNIANDLDIQVNDNNHILNLVYIDDVIKEFKEIIDNNQTFETGYKDIKTTYNITLGELAESIISFKNSRETRIVPNMNTPFLKKLYSTYLSYLPKNDFSYDLKMNIDDRGSFTEFLKSELNGQVSINISKPGIVKGNHWHHTKNEKFLVVSGHGVIRFRKYNSEEILEYFVSGKKLEVVDIPTGYTHNIENLGKEDMVTVMWANELFDANNPDTYYEEV